MSAGRPTEYKPEYCEQAEVYLMDSEDTLTERGKLQVKLPTTDGFARFLGVARSSLYLWEKSHPEFSDALDKIRNEQQERLLNMGLSGDYNPTIAKLVLSSNHGMREKTETDVTTGGDKITFGWNAHNDTIHTSKVGD
jgi:DNA-packaging protein gp3